MTARCMVTPNISEREQQPEIVACERCGTPGPWSVESYPGLCDDCAHDDVLRRMQVCENCDRLMVKDEDGWVETPNGNVYCPNCVEPLDPAEAPTRDELLRYDLGSLEPSA